MKVSYNWLKSYIPEVPDAQKLAELFTYHVCEVESMEKNGDDMIFDIKILPNRAHDLLSHQGIAKEIASILNIKYNDPISIYKVPEYSSTELKIENKTNKCRRYMGRIVRNVKIAKSPDWVVKHLESIGQRSINNIVDASNITMFDCGQPTHCFDLDKVKGPIIIREASEGEMITTLDNREVKLNQSNIVIADNEGVLAIAGVKGGKRAEVDENTKNIIIEVANFDPTSVRKTGKATGIQTDAVKRYENDLSPELCEFAMKEISGLFVEYSFKDFEEIVDIYPRMANLYKLGISSYEASKIIGIEIKDKDIEDIFLKFKFEYKKVKPIDEVLKLAPTFVGISYKLGSSISYDAPKSFDCSSLISYIFAYSGIQIPRVCVDQYIFTKTIEEKELQPGDLVFFTTGSGKNLDKTVDFLPGTLVKEEINHNGIYLGDDKIIHASGSKNIVLIESIDDLRKESRIKGPVYYKRVSDNSERYVVTVPSLRLDLRIKEDLAEEIGRIIGYDKLKLEIPKIDFKPKLNETYQKMCLVRNKLGSDGYTEVMTYAFREKGEVEVLQSASDKKFLRTNLSDGLKEAIKLNISNLPILGISEIKIFEIGTIFKKDIEEIHVAYGDKKEVKEMTLEEYCKNISTGFSQELKDYDLETKFKMWSVFPFIARDIAVWVPEEIQESEVNKIIKENMGNLVVRGPELFDQFTKKFPDGSSKTSYAYRLIFQSYERTLNDIEVNAIMGKITEKMNANTGWQVR